MKSRKKVLPLYPHQKNGNVKISKVGFSAVPNQNNGNFEICNVGFTAVR